MATDNTPPRLKLIVTIAVITVITLIGINFVLESYYAMMTDTAAREKLAPTRDRDEQHKAEIAALTNAALPIDQAIAQLGKGTRPEAITPQASEDLGPMTGWTKLPKPAPTAHPAAQALETAPVSDGGAPLADGGAPLAAGAHPVGDAGAHPVGDAGAHPVGDAGARRAPPAADGGVKAPRP